MMMMTIGQAAVMPKPSLLLTRMGHAVYRPRNRIDHAVVFPSCRFRYTGVSAMPSLDQVALAAMLPYRQRCRRMIMITIGHAAEMAKLSLQLTRIPIA
jgi:predicted naringenin-chalcone synthase